MSDYMIKYRLAFKNDERSGGGALNNQMVYVDMSPVSSLGDGDVVVYDLTPTATPFTTSIINNDRDKYSPIRSTQAKIQFIASSNFDITLFEDAGDNDWIVIAYIGNITKIIFRGYLVLSELSQLFLQNPIINLTASDHLAVLKDIPLTDFNGNNPTGYNKISKYIAWVLSKTGMDLPLYVVMNYREQDYPSDHMYDSLYLDAKTFEDNIGTCINCYDALSRIIGECCFITQRGGAWWIFNVDEFDTQPVYRALFDTNGDFQSFLDPVYLNKEINYGNIIHPINADRLLELTRPLKSIKETFNFRLPLEMPCNVDWSRGDLLDGSDPLSEKYDIECWDKLWSNTTTDDPETGIYKRVINTYPGYEKEHYIQIESHASHFRFIMSEAFKVTAKDKLIIDVQRRLSTDISGSGFFRDNTVQLRLYGADGTFWTCHGKTSVSGDFSFWIACDSTFRTNQKFFCIEGDGSEDQSISVSLYDGNVPEIPVDGEIKVLLYASGLWGSSADTYLEKCNIQYIPYIGGAYDKYHSQYQKIYRTSDKYLAKREAEIFISDSPSRPIKGGLFKLIAGPDYGLTGLFYNAAVFHDTPPSSEYFHPFGEIQAWAIWNQYRTTNRIFSGSLRGLESSTTDADGFVNSPHLIHKYYLQDLDNNTRNKYFMLLDFTQDWKSCRWSGTLVEVLDIIKTKHYDDNHEFKYQV